MTPLRIQMRELREAKGLTQQELADAAEIGRETVSRLENGRQSWIDLDVLDRLARILGVAPGLLLAETKTAAPRRGRPKQKR